MRSAVDSIESGVARFNAALNAETGSNTSVFFVENTDADVLSEESLLQFE